MAASIADLAERAATLRNLAAELADGRFFADAMRAAQDSAATWQGGIQMAFNYWFEMLDRWCRDYPATGIRKVADALEAHAAALRAVDTGAAAGITLTAPPPARLNYDCPNPPPYGEIGGTTVPTLDPAGVKVLAAKLHGTAEHAFAGPGGFVRRLETALQPTNATTTPAVNPYPPDADLACGLPHEWARSATVPGPGRSKGSSTASAPRSLPPPPTTT